MREQKTSVFQNTLFALIALCAVAITVLMVYQLTVSNKQIATVETELNSCKAQIEAQEDAIATAEAQLGKAEAQLGEYEEKLALYEKQVADLLTDKENEPVYTVSSTKEYAAWIAAQSALEPQDLYDDLKYAYEQLSELDANYMIGTEKYKAALDLLVPKKSHADVSSYMATLKRYFSVSDIHTVRNRIIEDFVSAKLINDEGNNSYTWTYTTLATQNIMTKLNLTEDVANALLGLLRTMDWDVG